MLSKLNITKVLFSSTRLRGANTLVSYEVTFHLPLNENKNKNLSSSDVRHGHWRDILFFVNV